MVEGNEHGGRVSEGTRKASRPWSVAIGRGGLDCAGIPIGADGLAVNATGIGGKVTLFQPHPLSLHSSVIHV